MEYHRKHAKALARAYRAGDRDAVRRAEAVLDGRARDRFLLSDAQYVVAREHGFRTWADLKRGHTAAPAWVVLPSNYGYGLGEPVEILVRKRGWRHDISDRARAVELAGRPAGWREVAEDVVGAYSLNMNRRGVVFVQCTESRLERLIGRLAECSSALYEELLERELGSP